MVNADFTAKMEGDPTTSKKVKRTGWCCSSASTARSRDHLDRALVEMKDWKRIEIPTEIACEKCGKPLVVKWGRNGESFLACSGYPACKNTKANSCAMKKARSRPSPSRPPTKSAPPAAPRWSIAAVASGEFGLLALSRVQDHAPSQPRHHVSQARLRRLLDREALQARIAVLWLLELQQQGCDFVSWDRPIKEPCPDCGTPFLLQKQTRQGPKLRCSVCAYATEVDNDDSPELPGEESSEEVEGRLAPSPRSQPVLSPR